MRLGERTSDLAQDRVGIAVETQEVIMRVELQIVQIVPPMIMGHLLPERLPEAFGGIGFRIVRGRVHETETIAVKRKGLAQLGGARRGVNAQVVGKNQGDAPPFVGAGDEVVELAAIDVGRASQRDAVREPTVAPVNGGEADDFGTLAGGADETLTVVPFARPAPGQGRMEANVDLVLDVKIGARQEREQLRHIGRHAIPELRFDERVPVEGCGGSGRRKSDRVGFGWREGIGDGG